MTNEFIISHVGWFVKYVKPIFRILRIRKVKTPIYVGTLYCNALLFPLHRETKGSGAGIILLHPLDKPTWATQ